MKKQIFLRMITLMLIIVLGITGCRGGEPITTETETEESIPTQTEVTTEEITETDTQEVVGSETEIETETETETESETETETETEIETESEAVSETETEESEAATETESEITGEQKPEQTGPELIASGLQDGGPITWTLTVDGVLTLEGNRSMVGQPSKYEWREYEDLITRVVIGDGITTISNSAFAELPNLKSVHVGKGVTIIESDAFARCYKLEEITFSANLEEIADYAFVSCENLERIILPEDSKLHTLREAAFNGTGIKELVMPESIQVVEQFAFCNCEKLESVVIDTHVQLGNNVFYNCINLKKMYLGENVRHEGSIGKCFGLEIIENYSYGNITPEDYRCIKTVICGPQITKTPNLKGCFNLETVVFIGDIKKIESHNFEGCESLKTITIPATVTEVGSNAFANSGVKEIWFLGDAPTMHILTFSGIEATLYYPAGNPTWEEAIVQTLAGDITWVPYEE